MFQLKSRLFILLLLSLTISISNFAHAENNKSKKIKAESIDIRANYLLLDEKKAISIYKGKVLLSKGTLIIKADKITLFSDGEKLTKALIVGSPADVKHQPENEAKVHSQAKKIEYFVTEERLILKGHAFVDQGDRHFSGETIEYDTRQRIITASGQQKDSINRKNNTPKRRVHVIIGPESDEKDENEANTNTENEE